MIQTRKQTLSVSRYQLVRLGAPVCAWCNRPLLQGAAVKVTDDDQTICFDHVYCDRARVRYLRRLDRVSRGVPTSRVHWR